MDSSRTLHSLLERAVREHPEKTALYDDFRSLTYEEWYGVSQNIATIMKDTGVDEGSVIGGVFTCSVFLPCVFTAVSMLGASLVSLNTAWPEQDRKRIFGRWSDRYIIGEHDVPIPIEEWKDVERIVAGKSIYNNYGVSLRLQEVSPDLPVYHNVTSGSTGAAKVALTTHSQLIANTMGVCSTLGLTADDVHLSLFGVAGHPHELFMRGLYLGGTTVLTEKKYPRDLLRTVSKTGVTVLMALPPQFKSISRLWGRSDADLSKVRLAEAGGMYVSVELMESFQRDTGVDMTPVWGSTETAGVALVGEPGISGFTKVVDGYTVKLVDTDGNAVAGSGSGEMLISGDAVVETYAGERAFSEEAFSDGWYRTGDIFKKEKEVLEFLGRRGGLIKAVGLKVYPLEVELAILKHPSVTDVCVVGIDHPRRGEMPEAHVIVKPGHELSPSQLKDFLKGKLDDHKIPREIRIVPALPRTPSGKIDRQKVGIREVKPDFRSEMLRSDVELVRLLNHRADLMEKIGGGFDPNWVDDQEDNAVGHNAGPISDSSIRELIRFIISELGKR